MCFPKRKTESLTLVYYNYVERQESNRYLTCCLMNLVVSTLGDIQNISKVTEVSG
jgi:hypothetical protein